MKQITISSDTYDEIKDLLKINCATEDVFKQIYSEERYMSHVSEKVCANSFAIRKEYTVYEDSEEECYLECY